WTVYRFAENRLPRAYALIAACLPIVFIPFGIPTCSYNTLGAMLFTAGAFTTLRAVLDVPQSRTFGQAGLLPGLACLAYPPLASAVGVSALMLRFAQTGKLAPEDARAADAGRQRANFWRYAFGLCAVGAVLLVVLLPGLRHHGLREALAYEQTTNSARGI